MTVGELLERIASSELVEWRTIFEAEDEQLENLRNRAGR